jgi:hypothetical protein
MAWLKVDQSLPNHRKTLRASDELGIPIPHIVGHLVIFWLWALDSAKDGDLDGLTPGMIARVSGWSGNPDEFLDALLTAGFFERDEGTLRIRSWEEYGGKLIDQRAEDAERKRKRKTWSEDVQNNSNGHPADIQRNSAGTPTDVHRTADVDKIRKDKIRKEKAYVGHTPTDSPSQEDVKSKSNPVQYREIMMLWNKIMPSAGKPAIKDMTETRKRRLKTLWRDRSEADFQKLDTWSEFLKYCTKSEFLMSGPWFTFDWVMKPENFQKIVEGNYHGETGGGKRQWTNRASS